MISSWSALVDFHFFSCVDGLCKGIDYNLIVQCQVGPLLVKLFLLHNRVEVSHELCLLQAFLYLDEGLHTWPVIANGECGPFIIGFVLRKVMRAGVPRQNKVITIERLLSATDLIMIIIIEESREHSHHFTKLMSGYNDSVKVEGNLHLEPLAELDCVEWAIKGGHTPIAIPQHSSTVHHDSLEWETK